MGADYRPIKFDFAALFESCTKKMSESVRFLNFFSPNYLLLLLKHSELFQFLAPGESGRGRGNENGVSTIHSSEENKRIIMHCT